MSDRTDDKFRMRDLLGRVRAPGRRDAFAGLVRLGNAARDARSWRDAMEHYGNALLERPDDRGILVQLGHARKEAGDLGGAEQAYLKALPLGPDDADLRVSLGHLYKLMDDRARTLEQYRAAIDLGSRDPHARHFVVAAGGELPALGRDMSSRAPEGLGEIAGVLASGLVPAFYLDVTDLVSYFRNDRFPTGVQRVEIELLRAARRWRGPVPLVLCVHTLRTGGWVELDHAQFEEVCTLAGQPGSQADQDWQLLIKRLFDAVDAAAMLDMLRGGALLNLAPWWQIDYMPALRQAKNTFGIRYVPVIYDLVPLITPEFLPAKMPSDCAQWLGGAIMHADAFVAISRWTRRDLVRAAEAVRPMLRDPIVMALDADFGGRTSLPSPLDRRRALERLGVSGGDFALFVATLEARKNHLIVFQSWARLIEQHGAGAVPTLVCVGRLGWRFEQTQGFLDAHPEVAAKVLLLSLVSDAELSTLYEECLFTVYSSTYEGWGLPVTESLSYGKACLTFSHSSLPEAGGEFAEYCSGDSIREIVDKAWRLISDAAYRTSREALIATKYRPRGWSDVLSGLLADVAAQLQTPVPTKQTLAPLALGELYELHLDRDLRQPDRRAAVAEMLRHGLDWNRMEDEITWTAARDARLAFHVPELPDPDADLLIYLEVESPPAPTILQVKLGAARLIRLPLREGEKRQLRLHVPLSALGPAGGDDRPIMLNLGVDVVTELPDEFWGRKRRAGVGLRSVLVCQTSDTEARLRMIERTAGTRKLTS